MSNLALIGLAILLVLLNGFFVAAEFGLVKLRQTRVRAIARRLGWRGRILLRVHSDLDAYLSACQLGITLASLGLGWIGEPAFADLMYPLFQAFGIAGEKAAHAIAFFFAFFIISYLHIVVGELAPKSIAIRVSEAVGVWTAIPLYVFYWLMFPAIWILNRSANWLLRQMRLDIAHGQDARYSPEELKIILRASRAESGYTAEEWGVLAQALDFRNLQVADLMRPFNEASTLDLRLSLKQQLEHIASQRYSRYPCIAADGRISGIVHLKDVFVAQQQGKCPDNLGKLARPLVTVVPSLPAADLFRRFREGAPHFAVVSHPDSHPLGFITLDNLLGALVGEIRDEFRTTHNEWTRLDDGSLIGKGSLPLFTLERALGIDIEECGVDSVSGLIQHKLGDLPREGQRIDFERFDIVVKKMRGPRILLVRIYPKEEPFF